MKMVINEIKCENNTSVAEGITAIGIIKGIWKDKTIPTLGNTYSVELNIKELYKNNVSILSNKVDQSKVYVKDKMVFFIGWCEDVDDVYFIRFTDDWIEMIEFDDKDIDIKKGDCILFYQRYDSISIYPY